MRDLAEIFDPARQPFLIAEVGLGHDGSLGLAHAFIDAIASTGADAVKFQTHIAEAESTPLETFRIPFSFADATRYDYWRRTSFSEEQWAGLKRHADDKDLVFLSSPFSLAAVELLERVGVAAWKIASGELGSRRMLDRMAATGKPLLASTGMSSLADAAQLVATLQRIAPGRHAILQCTTEYPTPPQNVGLNVLQEYLARFECPIGLSDHSGTPWPAVVAASMGARLIEVHATMSPHMFGPDVTSSLTIERLADVVAGVRFAHEMRVRPVDKDAQAAAKAPLRKLFGKAAFALRPLAAGEVPAEDAIDFRKPGMGLSEADFDSLAGRPLVRGVAAGVFLQKEDFS